MAALGILFSTDGMKTGRPMRRYMMKGAIRFSSTFGLSSSSPAGSSFPCPAFTVRALTN